MALQSTVPTSQLVFDHEATFGTVPASGQKGRVIYFNPPFDWGRNQDQSASEAVTGTRYPTKPWRGNIALGADLTLPFDTIGPGYFLYLATGAGNYAAEEYSYSDDVKVGTPTLSITSGVATFDSAQTGAALYDMVIYENSSTGARFTGFLSGDASGDATTWDIDFDLAGTSACADITTATLVAIVPNQIVAANTTITLSSGTGTLSQSEAGISSANALAGAMLIYDTTGGAGGAITKVFMRSMTTSGTVAVFEQANRSLAADASARPVLGIFSRPYCHHLFKPLSSGVLPSGVIDLRASMDTTRYHLSRGVSCNTFSFMAGGDGEQVCSFGLLGVDEDRNNTSAYDSAALAPQEFTRFEKPDFSAASLDSVAVADVESIDLTFTNNLEENNRAVGTSGLRRAYPAGFVGVSGTMVRHYQLSGGVGGATTMDDMDARTERKIIYTLVNGTNQFIVTIPEVHFKPDAVGVPTGVGRRVTAKFDAFYENGTVALARSGAPETITGAPIVFELINTHQSYV